MYLELLILELSKVLMYEFRYDYVKPKYGEKANLCYMDTVRFIIYIKADDIYKNIPEDLETRFDTSTYERPLPKGKNKKAIGLMKDKLNGENFSYLIDDDSDDKKARKRMKKKDRNKCVI